MKPEILAQCPLILREFLGYTETIKGKSPKTVEEYFLDLRTFFRFMKKKWNLVEPSIDFEEISIEDIDLELVSQ